MHFWSINLKKRDTRNILVKTKRSTGTLYSIKINFKYVGRGASDGNQMALKGVSVTLF